MPHHRFRVQIITNADWLRSDLRYHYAASDNPADACFAMAAMILVLGLLFLVGEVMPIGRRLLRKEQPSAGNVLAGQVAAMCRPVYATCDRWPA